MREWGKPISPSTFVWWSGLAAILGGVLFTVWGYIHRDYAPSYFTSIGYTLSFIVPLFFQIGMAGLYWRSKGPVG